MPTTNNEGAATEQQDNQTQQNASAGAEQGTPKGNNNSSPWTTLAETIAGDNKMVSAILKFILSPFGLVVFLAGVGFLIYKNISYRNKITALKQEIKTLRGEKDDLKEDLAGIKEKLGKIKQRKTIDYSTVQDVDYIPVHSTPFKLSGKSKSRLFD